MALPAVGEQTRQAASAITFAGPPNRGFVAFDPGGDSTWSFPSRDGQHNLVRCTGNQGEGPLGAVACNTSTSRRAIARSLWSPPTHEATSHAVQGQPSAYGHLEFIASFVSGNTSRRGRPAHAPTRRALLRPDDPAAAADLRSRLGDDLTQIALRRRHGRHPLLAGPGVQAANHAVLIVIIDGQEDALMQGGLPQSRALGPDPLNAPVAFFRRVYLDLRGGDRLFSCYLRR